MNIGTLSVVCDNIERTSPTRSGNDTFLTLLLDDVDASGLMRQMVEQLDPEDLLDYFKDEVIEEYLAERKSTTLSPREQYEALANE
jgi:uncharacterized ferredoxin-like protein